jgi:SH3-like domain-containing protein
MLFRAAFIMIVFYLTVTGPAAQAAPRQEAALRLDTPSGFPVPRFVSLKEDETNCRIGPGFDHPVRYVFRRAGAPVLVVAESIDHWRKVRDSVGDECWVHQTTIRAQTHVLVIGDATLRRQPAEPSDVTGRLGDGVLAKLGKRTADWVFLSAGEARGWAPIEGVWGGDPLADAPERKN